ncbi:AbrB/MazE/SpoVT family DNA-binding domain-containing protein [Bacillus sp. T33-2]|uniref:AbrB/MazE/SpoVT family DNA-binding domain-containing protein n=1 Tax=Bacillus sp. T33-2 TaxID=2054168 RepID=UPI000C77B582|nr:AbrB/MazE/SpoVT family DNA-binding domain-containing protein [Bacillus sp. T33-2]PLR99043.1 hypothetical protein CVD19_02965 [Bacillus sp. T33-2]
MIFEVAKILPKYQITLPKEVRDFLEAEIGDKVLLINTEAGILIKKLNEPLIQKIKDSQSKE